MRRFLRNERGHVAVGSAIGLAVTAKTEDVFWAMRLSGASNTAFSNTVTTVYSAWPLMGLIVIALIAAAILIAIAIIR